MAETATNVVCFCLYRLLLPAAFLAAAAFRFNGLSFFYLVCLLVVPLLPNPSSHSMSGSTGIFLKVLIALTSLIVTAHATFHITLVAIATDDKPYGYMLQNCSASERLARSIGFQRLDNVPIKHAFRLIMPDVVVWLLSILVLVICSKMIKRNNLNDRDSLSFQQAQQKRRRRLISLLDYVGEFFCGLCLAACSIMIPSVLSSVYFITLLTIAVMWACYTNLGVGFARFRIVLLVYTGAHILVLHLYQFQFFQEVLNKDSLTARLLGLTGVIKTDCSKVYSMEFYSDVRWWHFVNPGVLLVLYWLLAYETRVWFRVKNLTPAEITLAAALSSSRKRRSRTRKSHKNSERQVAGNDVDETGSLVFSGSTYGDTDGEDECLVEVHDDNTNYSTMQTGAGPDVSQRSEAITDHSSIRKGSPPARNRNHLSAEETKRAPVVSVLVFIMKQSHVLMLISMMAWSIMYVSWLTFSLLLGACLLWMLPNSRRACLVASPVLVLYVVALVIAQYIFNMNLSELPTDAGTISVSQIGLQKFNTPPKDLAFHLIFMMFFLMTLRQFMRERKLPKEQPTSFPLEIHTSFSESIVGGFGNLINDLGWKDSIDGYDSTTVRIMGHIVMVVLCKYFIFICTGMLLLISMQEVVIYRAIYMILFLLFMICFQISYSLWRTLMFAFWWTVIIYSMTVLIIIYTYQFEQFPDYWRNSTGWNDTVLSDIGLEKFNGTELFVKLLTPTSFLIVMILQVHYFHKPFLRLSALDRYKNEDAPENIDRIGQWMENNGGGATTTSETDTDAYQEDEASPVKMTWQMRFITYIRRERILIKTRHYYNVLTTFLWRLAELHMFKVVVIVTMYVALKEDQVSALTAVYVILVSLLLPFVLTKAHLLLSHLILVWTSLVILTKVLYQLKLVSVWDSEICNMTEHVTHHIYPNKSIFPVVWFGLEKVDMYSIGIDQYISLYIMILVVVIFESIVRYHQSQLYNTPDLPKPKEGIIFDDVVRGDADKGLLLCVKFFANYAFFKFGLEICYIAAAVVVCIRMDVFGVLYAILLGIMMLMNRKLTSQIWWLYLVVLAILLPVQFLVVLGFPPISSFCFLYPWNNRKGITDLLERWLYLPDFANNPPSSVLMADVIQLMVVAMQWKVFRLERSTKDLGGGCNDEILPDVEACKEIPVKDFTVKTTCYLDVCKQMVFEYLFWVTLAVVFITGATRINFFGLGYVVAVFWYMWYGKEFLLKPLRKLLHMWNLLIAYVVFVLFAKACLQLVGCVYVQNLFENQCWLIQLFGINCLLSSGTNIIQMARAEDCIIVEDNTGLTWDVVCFAMLLLQRRIYSSHYFRHVVDLLGAQNILSSRGAELINRILVREVEKQKEQEKQILINIKKKMKILKERQATLRKDFQEPTEHFQAIRAGDYYLFDDTEEEMNNEELLSKQQVPDSLTFGMKESTEERKLNPLQVLTTAMDQGAEAAVERMKQQDTPEAESMPGTSSTQVDLSSPKDETAKDDASGTAVDKARTWGQFFAALLASMADWIISLCNRISRNYRLVAHQLEGDLKLEKEKIKFHRSQKALQRDDGLQSDQETEVGYSQLAEVMVAVDANLPPRDPESPACTSEGSMNLEQIVDEGDNFEFDKQQPRAYRLLVAMGYMLVSRSELLCYFLMVLDQIVYASLLSLPLPFMVFLWGMLSVPRPSKTFWITVITYTEAVVVAKYLFQFGFFPWNDGAIQDNPFFPPRILGIEQNVNYANIDIALLLALFIHRSILKKYGLWKDSKDITDDMVRAGKMATHQTNVKQSVVASVHPQLALEENEMSIDADSKKDPEEEGRVKRAYLNAVAPFVNFFKKITECTYNATVDVYAPMFCCDFINFFIVVFGYKAFGPLQQTGDANVASYINENKVPVPFLIMLITQFVLIVIDRALFLRKNVLGKFIFQTVLVILIHIWMFFILPSITKRSFFENPWAQLWYFIKCVYFALSAYQIRCGYPTRILGNFLTKQYGYLNLFLFKGFLAVPFLLELRSLMDWIWTDSTLALGSWLQMEDIYANIFVLKCWRHSEVNYPTPRAQKKTPAIKYGVGGLLLFLIILVIWFPLVLFSIFNVIYKPNPPLEVTVQLQVGAFQPLFKSTVQQSIRLVSETERQQIITSFERNRNAMALIGEYEPPDMTAIEFVGESTSIWAISAPAQEAMITDLNIDHNNTYRPNVEFTLTVLREASGKASETLNVAFSTTLSREQMKNLSHLINGTTDANGTVLVETLRIDSMFPRFLKLSTKGISPASSLLTEFGFDTIRIQLYGDKNLSSLNKYWGMEQLIYGNNHLDLNKKDAANFTRNFKLFSFNDKRAPDTLSFISGYGIIGLYVSFILLIGRFLRLSITGQYLTIIFRELPVVDSILQLCLDIYLVREMKEFHLEEDLYAKLVFVYRSPETMIKVSRPKPKLKED